MLNGRDSTRHRCSLRPPLSFVPSLSDRRDRASVDNVLGAVDRGGALRDQKCDQLGDLLGTVWAPSARETSQPCLGPSPRIVSAHLRVPQLATLLPQHRLYFHSTASDPVDLVEHVRDDAQWLGITLTTSPIVGFRAERPVLLREVGDGRFEAPGRLSTAVRTSIAPSSQRVGPARGG